MATFPPPGDGETQSLSRPRQWLRESSRAVLFLFCPPNRCLHNFYVTTETGQIGELAFEICEPVFRAPAQERAAETKDKCGIRQRQQFARSRPHRKLGP